jgi:hypothetical protein
MMVGREDGSSGVHRQIGEESGEPPSSPKNLPPLLAVSTPNFRGQPFTWKRRERVPTTGREAERMQPIPDDFFF